MEIIGKLRKEIFIEERYLLGVRCSTRKENLLQMQIASLYIYYGRKISVRCKIYTQIDFKSHKFTRAVNFYIKNDNWSPRRLQQNSCQMDLLDVPMCNNVNRLSNFIPAEKISIFQTASTTSRKLAQSTF